MTPRATHRSSPSARACRSNARREAPKGGAHGVFLPPGHCQREHRPGVEPVGEQPELRGQHADHPILAAAARQKRGAGQLDGPADDRRVGAVAPLPEGVRENHAARTARQVLVAIEGAAEGHPHAEHVEQVVRDAPSQNRLRSFVAEHAEIEHRVPGEACIGKALPPVRERGQRDPHGPSVRVPRFDPVEPFRFGERQGGEQHRRDDAQERHAGADGDRDREPHRGAQPPMARQRSPAVPDIAPEPLGATPAPRLARQLADQRDVAEVAARRQPRGVGGQSLGDSLVRLFGQVEPDLLVELRLQPPPAPQGAHSDAELPPHRHAVGTLLIVK